MSRVDVHNHFLPGIDDGCRTLSESLACLRLMADNGYGRIFCTPHCGASEYGGLTPGVIAAAVENLNKMLREERIAIELRPGGELRLTPELATSINRTDIPTYGQNTRYCLVDIWEDTWPDWADTAVCRLQDSGLKVILAHPERMVSIQKRRDLVDEFTERGLLFQGNLGPLGGSDSALANSLAVELLREDRYFMLGSDGHRPDHMDVRIRGLQRAVALVGYEKAQTLLETNPAKLWI